MSLHTPSPLSRQVAAERLAQLWERLWAALHWPLVTLALVLAASFAGLPQMLSGLWHWAFPLAAMVALIASCAGLSGLRLPSRLSAMRRLEERAALVHRPLSSAGDSLAPEFLDPRADAIWEEHQRRKLLALTGVAAAWPSSGWRRFDPWALKVPAGLALVAAFLLGPGHVSDSWRAPPPPSAALAASKTLSFDVWLKPPSYTGRPPLLLTSPQVLEKLARGDVIDAPENSQFSARISNGAKPALAFRDGTGAALADAPVPHVVNPNSDTWAADFTFDRSLTVDVRDGDTLLASIPLRLVPDEAPTISIVKTPHAAPTGAFITDGQVKDDYGVTALSGDMELADEQEGGTGFESNGIFLYEPPKLSFALRHPNAREETGATSHDLTAHPWAGFNVTLTLTAWDAAKQEGQSKTVMFRLPERQFIRPMAAALIEQRKQLILYPERAQDIGDMLDTLILYPDGVIDRSGQVAAIAMLSSRLHNATGYEDVKLVVDGLWKVATDIEEGSLGDAKQELQALKKELEKALAEGAPPEKLQQLMDKMRKAMDRYMDELQKQAERQMKDGSLKQSQNGKSVSRDQLKKMMDELEKSAKGGQRDMAQQMLDQLDKLLQNLQPGMGREQADGETSKMMDDIGKMMREQQKLMDETQRQPGPGQQGGEGGTGDQGQQGEESNRGKGMGGLADRQQSLEEMLGKMLGQNGRGEMPSELGEAGKAMKEAEQGLRGGDKDGALRDQGQALDQLRKGMGKLAQQMRDKGQGQTEGDAQDAEGKGGNDDPLGRPRATNTPDTGPDKNMLPSEQAMERAREILKTLRSRANEGGLSDGERSYIDRLLRGLY
ncbi:MAG: TIGR02302 family protein [Hyphomicrobiales bacterium]